MLHKTTKLKVVKMKVKYITVMISYHPWVMIAIKKQFIKSYLTYCNAMMFH
jgi:hypothetical protein